MVVRLLGSVTSADEVCHGEGRASNCSIAFTFFQCIIVTCNLFVNLIDRVTEHVVAKWFGDL